MTERICDQREQLVDLLYGEGEAEHLAHLERHVGDCPACAAEMSALGGVRGTLRAWTPPDTPFRIIPDRPAARGWWPAPGWGLAAAAILMLAVGAGIANLEISYGPEGLVARTGWSKRVEPPASPAAAAGVSVNDLRALENRLRAELAASVPQGTPAAAAMPVAAAPYSDAEVMRRVRVLIDESERRQDRELALRLTQVVKDFDMQRQADLTRIQAGFGELQGMTGAEVARQREQLNYLMRVSSRQRP